jgi:flavin reductase (DIM6/NTAB) family NADH-FMN oxidoreductase RutF
MKTSHALGRPGVKHKRVLSLAKVYGLLEPGPVVLLGTHHKGISNVMTMSWHTMMEFDPPLVGCVVSARNFSFVALKKTRQCALNIPTADIAAAVIGCGNSSGRNVDKFAQFGLTPLPAKLVNAPVIAECFANLECRVVDTRMCNRYNFFVLEVLRASVLACVENPRTLHHRGYGKLMVAGRIIELPSRMR